MKTLSTYLGVIVILLLTHGIVYELGYAEGRQDWRTQEVINTWANIQRDLDVARALSNCKMEKPITFLRNSIKENITSLEGFEKVRDKYEAAALWGKIRLLYKWNQVGRTVGSRDVPDESETLKREYTNIFGDIVSDAESCGFIRRN